MQSTHSSAPAGQSALHNMMSVTNAQQRSISESSIVRSSSSHPAATTRTAPQSLGNLRNYSIHHGTGTRYYENRNTTFMMINRSGGSTVKAIIPSIQARCHDAINGTTTSAPEEECYLLAQWAVDAFYKVVIASNGGIPALIRAMQCFPHSARLQESCCTALANLCTLSTANQNAVERHGGVHPIIAAMKCHATSVAVQSAACDALSRIPPTLVVQTTFHDNDLLHVLQNAKDMYLHPTHKRTAEYLLTLTVHHCTEATRRC